MSRLQKAKIEIHLPNVQDIFHIYISRVKMSKSCFVKTMSWIHAGPLMYCMFHISVKLIIFLTADSIS